VTTVPGSVTPQWLRLREPADAAARALRLVESVRGELVPGATFTVHDIGCGSGSMGRWLAPLLPSAQRWVLHDRDVGLLELAASEPPHAPDGFRVTVETSAGDLADLAPEDLADASLLTASAVLDILTEDEVEALVAAITTAGCPALITLSVTGKVRFSPSDPLDGALGAAFNEHQRRTAAGRALLGPDAPRRATELFRARGAEVQVAESDWRLDGRDRQLLQEWLDGWVGAACEQRPDLASSGELLLERRRGQAAEGRLEVTVGHVDLLARPGRGG
jgi:trans-aconitate methyltransferase